MAKNESQRDADLEYGPTPEDAQYEHTDIEPSIAWKFAIWLTVAMLISASIVYGTFWLFEGREQAAARDAQMFPLAVGVVREPEGPRLQTQPFGDVRVLRDIERQRMTTYGWVDQEGGVVRIPVEEAMRLISERGAIPAGAEPVDGVEVIVQDSSSGRTAVSRTPQAAPPQR
jgi:hypothetical protein